MNVVFFSPITNHPGAKSKLPTMVQRGYQRVGDGDRQHHKGRNRTGLTNCHSLFHPKFPIGFAKKPVSRDEKLWSIRESFSDTDYVSALTPNMRTPNFSNLTTHCSQRKKEWRILLRACPLWTTVNVIEVCVWTPSFIKLHPPLATLTPFSLNISPTSLSTPSQYLSPAPFFPHIPSSSISRAPT